MDVFKKYHQDGFYIAKNILDKDDVNKLVQDIKKTFDDQLTYLELEAQITLYDSMKLLHGSDIGRYKKTISALWRKLSVYDFLHHQKIQNFIRKKFHWGDIFIPGGQVIHLMAESLKIPGGYFGAPIHQDFPSVQGSLDGLVIWVPLLDVDKNNYPMEVIPGSHKNGVLPSFENSNSNWIVRPEAYNEKNFVPVECNAGDIVLMSYFTVHRSSTVGDDRLRLACSTRYDNASEKTFIERAYPTAYVRTVQRTQLT